VIIIYNIDEKFMYEILGDYKDALRIEEKNEIFNKFCSSIWGNDNKRRITNREIKFNVRKDLLSTEIGKIFETWSVIPYISYKQKTNNTDYASLIRQKTNNIYTNMFDGTVCLRKEYMDLIKTPKTLYFRWCKGEHYSAKELTKEIDDRIDDSISIKEKYAKQKMKLPWNDYKNIVEGYFRKMFDNYICLDDYEDKTKLTLHIDTWNEDNFCVGYFCRSLDGEIRKYQKKYYGISDHKTYKRCEKCGNLFSVNYHNKKLCDNCSAYQPIGIKTIKCSDCGCDVTIDAKDTKTCRCNKCYIVYRKNKKLETQRIRRKKLK